MSTIYSFAENAPSVTAIADADVLPIIQSGVLKQISGAVLNSSRGGTVDTGAAATTLSLTQATHGNKTVTVSATVPIAITLPAASGSNTMYRLIYQVAATGTSSTIKVANASDAMQGVYMSPVTGTATHMAFAAVSSAGTTATRSDTLSFNGTTTGGAIGCLVELWDIQTGAAGQGFWQVLALDTCVSVTTTPFSAGV